MDNVSTILNFALLDQNQMFNIVLSLALMKKHVLKFNTSDNQIQLIAEFLKMELE